MTNRLIIVPLRPVAFAPPGIDPAAFRRALAEDVIDLIVALADVDSAVAVTGADRPLADELVWPQTKVFELTDLSVVALLSTAGAAGYLQAAVVAPDAPDVPAMILAKLLQPLPRMAVVAAPSSTGGLLGLAAQLPAPPWLTSVDLETDIRQVRAAAPDSGLVAVTPGWHRLTGPDGLSRLDPAVDGWIATRTLLGAGMSRSD